MINVNELRFKKFSGGELHLMGNWIYNFNPNIEDTALCRIQSTDDFMKLCLFVNAVKAMGYEVKNLVLPYIPYARQDRIANQGEALSIKVFAQLLNSLKFEKVVVFDPHSDVCTALIDNVVIVPQEVIWGSYIKDNYINIDLISPDAGALKRIYSMNDVINNREKIVEQIRIGMKHRDTITRKVTNTTIDGSPISKTAIIVDDICDEGDTAIELAKVIREQYTNLIFCVTHGIFSKGTERLEEYFDEIITTNSWNPNIVPESKLKVINIEDIFEGW